MFYLSLKILLGIKVNYLYTCNKYLVFTETP